MAAYTLVETTWPDGSTSSTRHVYRDLTAEQLRRIYTAHPSARDLVEGDALVRRRQLHTMACTGAKPCPQAVDRITFHDGTDEEESDHDGQTHPR